MNNEERHTGMTSMNNEYQVASVIQMRLDTTKILADLEAFYRGTRVIGYTEAEGGMVQPLFDKFGRERMNEKGIQDMMSWLAALFNPQTVQGNKKDEDYQEFMSNLHADIASNLMINLVEYDISENDFDSIVDKTLAIADMFFSRTIDNLERESYASTMRSETRSIEGGRSMLSDILPFRRRGG